MGRTDAGSTCYCRTLVAAGIGFAIAAPVLLKKIVPRVSVANARWPVCPTVLGTAPDQYDDIAAFAAVLQVFAASVTCVTPADASAARETF